MRFRLHRAGAESYLTIRTAQGDQLARFPCTLQDLRSVVEGRSYQFTDVGGSLTVKRSEGNLWFVVSVAEHGLEDSCLVPCEDVERILDELELGWRPGKITGVVGLVFAFGEPISGFLSALG